MTGRTRKLPALLSGLLILALCAGRTATAGDGAARYLVLKQIIIYEDSYFVPASADLILIKASNEEVKSNVIVYAQDVHRRVDAYFKKALVDQWMDPYGHIHTSELLERQMDYLGFRVEFDYAMRTTTLKKGRDEPLSLPSLQPSGALTQDTLLIPFYKLETTYERSFMKWEEGCPSGDGGARWPWRHALDKARRALNAYKRIALAAPLKGAGSVPNDWLRYDPPDPYWGLEYLNVSRLSRLWERDSLFSTNRRIPFPLRINVSGSWGYIPDETVDIEIMDAAGIGAAEQAARAAVEEAVSFCPSGR